MNPMKTPNAFRVSLRDLFWLILVVGMGLGWYRERQVARPIREAVSLYNHSKAKPAIRSSSPNTAAYGAYGDVRFIVMAVDPEMWDFYQGINQ
jgi:hypothetical protein